jgi:hypothetical protein
MEEINIIVNGKEITLTEFPKSIIIKTILGMISALKGVDKNKNCGNKNKKIINLSNSSC